MSRKSSSKDRPTAAAPWVPDPDSIVGSLIHGALSAMEEHGGRPEIRDVAANVRVERFTVIACGNLTRKDFPDLPTLTDEMNAPDPSISSTVTRDHLRNHRDIRGIAFDLLLDTIHLKERLDEYRRDASPERFDEMFSSLHTASQTRGVLHNAFDASFESNLTKLRQQRAQNTGRETKRQRFSSRDVGLVRVAQERLHEQARAGKKRNISALARYVIRHYEEKGKSDSLPSEKRICAILREHLK